MTTLMQGLIQLSGHPLVYALGWTLLHFLWQGAAVALVLGCVLALLGGRPSQARYGAACLALALMVALPAATFAHIASVEYKARAAMLGPGVVLDAGFVFQVGVDEPVPPWPARLGMTLDHALPWVLLAWFAGVLVFLSRLNFGLLVARRLKTAATEPPPVPLLQLFETLRIRLGVNRAVELLHSAQVQVPTVIGWLRPVVLLPVTCLTGLTPEQIEAVLCHELAHVRRHDYLVSVIQSVIETVLFYHPAVWWVSRQVRRERECCCDELAVAAGGNVLAYARALSYLEESRAPFPEFVLGANGGVLKMRIKRILGNKSDVEGSPVAALVALGMILAIAGSYFAVVSHAQAQAAREQIALASAATPSAASPAATVSVSQEATAAAANQQQQSLPGVYKSWLNEDVLWIITPAERSAFLRLANDQERDEFINQFWAHRNPPGAPAGAYREEHYSRIAYSNQHFASNTQVGWRSDRGHVYIVYGKPESIDSHPTGGAYPYEVWHYPYIAGIGDNVDIRFVDTCSCGEYHYTIDQGEKDLLGARMTATPAPNRVLLASRILAPGGAGAAQSATPPSEAATQQSGSISGTIVDPNGALIPRANVKTLNTDTGFTKTTVTDKAGSYSFSGLPPGPYWVEVQLPGFQRLLQENIQVKSGQTVGLNLKLSVGAATETLTVNGKPIAAAPPSPPPPPLPYRCVGCAAAPKPAGPQRVSAGVVQGLAISQPQPVYPEDAKAKHIQGVVVLHARISKEGTITDLQYISGPPALVVSAIDAVRQWKYKPYLIDGEPTEVDTTINIHYTFGDDNKGTAPASPPEGSVRVPADVMQGNLVYKVEPVYPEIAKAAHVQGVVVLHAHISKTGDVEDLQVVSGSPMLTNSAIEAVRQWKYTPYMFDGKTLEAETTISVNFTLPDAPKSQAQVPIIIPRPPDMELYERGTNAIADGWYEQGRLVLETLISNYPNSQYVPRAWLAIKQADHLRTEPPNIRSIDYKGLNSVTIQQVEERLRSAGVDIHLETPYDAARIAQAAAVMKQLLAEHGRPNAIVIVGTQSIPPRAIAIQFSVKEGPKGAAPKSGPVSANGTPTQTHESASVAPKLRDGATAPVLIYKVDPEFTEQARKAKAQGVVLVNFIVDTHGSPEHVHVLRGIGNGLDHQAVQAVSQYRFKPAMKNDKPVQEALNVEVNFQIF